MNKTFYQISKEVALLFAGALIGVVAIYFEPVIKDNPPYLIAVLIFLVLYGIGMFDRLLSGVYWIVSLLNKKYGIVGVYAPYEVKPGNSSWVNVNLEDISKTLMKKNIKYRITDTTRAFREYPVILNPYGGVYPEQDSSALKSLDGILDYVRNGGTYINIADIPFYFAYDQHLNRKIDTTPLAGDFTFERSFLMTVMTQRLKHYVFGLTKGKDFDKGVARVIQLSETSENLYDKNTFEDGPQGHYSPVLKIPYGRGYFIFSTLQIGADNLGTNLKRVIDAAF